MYWIYILRCEDGYYYVGQTSRLFRRFWEHDTGFGSINTNIYKNQEIVAIYKANKICKFTEYIDCIETDNYNMLRYFLKKFNQDYDEDYEDYDILEAENNIAERLMLNKEDWFKIRGGKYIKFNVDYKYPENIYLKDLPLCNCGLPCDIKKNEENDYLFFRCPKKNMWKKFREIFNINEYPCEFFMKYTQDKNLRLKIEERKIQIQKLFKESSWLDNVETDDGNYNPCIGGCCRTSKSIKLSYKNIKRNLCYDCFLEKNKKLMITYSSKPSIYSECFFK
jgi:hypothetical protein